MAGRLARVPVVVHTVHGFSFNDSTFGAGYRRCFAWLEAAAARCCDVLVTVSDTTLKQAIAHGIAPRSRAVTIYSGIDLTPFGIPVDRQRKLAELGLDAGRPVVGTVGRLAPSNAPEAVAAIARKLCEQRPDVQFLIVGDGPSMAEVQALTGGHPRIHLAGYRGDVAQVLRVLDVFVSTALWGGIGRALTEAMIAGLPVVGFSACGIPEIVRDGDTGYLVRAGDVNAVVERVLRLLGNPAQARRLGLAAKDMVLSRFDADVMVDQIARLYERVLAEKSRSRER